MKAKLAIAVYLGAIVAGNMLAGHYGPWVTPVVGFFLIGLDLTLRDILHQGWSDRGVLRRNMLVLIIAGSALTLAVCWSARRIALASTAAFSAEAAMATLIYSWCTRWPCLWKINAANLVGGLVDSLVFPTLAFGMFLPGVTAAQWGTKFAGGFVWALILTRWKKKVDHHRVSAQ